MRRFPRQGITGPVFGPPAARIAELAIYMGSTKMKNLLKRFLKDERGLETVEYAIIAGLITIAAIAIIASIGREVANRFETLDAKLKDPNAAV